MSQANTTLTEQESGWINECAGRLRLIQTDAATAAPEKRHEYLQEEVARSLKEVAPANRQRYVQALIARFPVAGQIVSSAAPVPAPASPPVAESVDELMERFIAAAANLPEEKRTEFSKRLLGAGFVLVDRDALVLEISDELRQKLGLPADQQPNLKRLVELAVFLVDALCVLDERALKTMRELDPRSPLIKRAVDFRTAAARFLIQETESLEAQWGAMRGLLGGLLAAILLGGNDFGKKFVGRFSPSAIEDVLRKEGKTGGGVLGGMIGPSKKDRCWDRYEELERAYDSPDKVARIIKDCLKDIVERTVLSGR